MRDSDCSDVPQLFTMVENNRLQSASRAGPRLCLTVSERIHGLETFVMKASASAGVPWISTLSRHGKSDCGVSHIELAGGSSILSSITGDCESAQHKDFRTLELMNADISTLRKCLKCRGGVSKRSLL